MSIEAGRELDALIAEKVFGCRVLWQSASVHGPYCGCLCKDGYKKGPHGDPAAFDEDLPYYSTDISAAWLVVERMRSSKWNFCIVDMQGRSPTTFCAQFGETKKKKDGKGRGFFEAAESAPLAICVTALAAVGEKR